MNTITEFKWFWAWQDEKEEAWLAEMAKDGYHLESLALPGQYIFRKGTPGDYIYRLDFQALRTKDKESYQQLFADAGWEHLGDMGGWVYFRHEVTGNEIPEIYSDMESKIGKYHRLISYLVIFLPIMIILLPNVSEATRIGPFTAILTAISSLLILLYAIAMVQIFRRINKLKGKKL